MREGREGWGPSGEGDILQRRPIYPRPPAASGGSAAEPAGVHPPPPDPSPWYARVMEVGSVFRPVRLRILVIPLLLLAAFAIYYPFSPASQQRRRMEAGQQHVRIIKAAIAPHSAGEVQVGVSTANLGSILVHGEAADDTTAKAISDAVR